MKRMILRVAGIAVIAALMFPAAAFAANGQAGGTGKDKAAVQAQRQADRAAAKEQRAADKLAMKDMTPEERQALRKTRIAERKAKIAEKRAAVKAKVKEHRIKKLQDIKAKKEANGSTDTPGYRKIVNWLNKLLGTNS
jgi:hypothetical protein